MPAKKLDYIIICDIADTEPVGFLEDWLDANLKRAEIRPFDYVRAHAPARISSADLNQ